MLGCFDHFNLFEVNIFLSAIVAMAVIFLRNVMAKTVYLSLHRLLTVKICQRFVVFYRHCVRMCPVMKTSLKTASILGNWRWPDSRFSLLVVKMTRAASSVWKMPIRGQYKRSMNMAVLPQCSLPFLLA